MYKIAYPDASGWFGGALMGFFLTWVFLPSDGGSLKNASRRQKGLFFAGLIISVLILVIIICVFSFSYDPKEYWFIEDVEESS